MTEQNRDNRPNESMTIDRTPFTKPRHGQPLRFLSPEPGCRRGGEGEPGLGGVGVKIGRDAVRREGKLGCGGFFFFPCQTHTFPTRRTPSHPPSP